MTASQRWAEHTERLYDLVTDDWQPLEPVFQKVIATIPPGKALRRGSVRLNGVHTEAETIESGARSFVNASLATLRNTGLVETRSEANGTRIRRKPQVAAGGICPHCGRDTADPQEPRLEKRRKEHPASAKIIPFPTTMPSPVTPSSEPSQTSTSW